MTPTEHPSSRTAMPISPYIQAETFPLILRWIAKCLSYLFHPLFIPLYVTAFLEYVHPTCFVGYGALDKKKLFLLIALNAVFFPLVTVLIAKGLGFIESIFLRTQRDRIIPYISSMIFFFWTQYVLREQDMVPRLLVGFMFGVFISSAAALIANIYYKVSMHAIGMGGVIGLFLVILFTNSMLMTWPLCVALLIAGLVCSSRLLLGSHYPKEIYAGILIGMCCQLIGGAMYL